MGLEYYYHATLMSIAFEILEEGKLKPHKPNYGTEQDFWPDGSAEKRSYFGLTPKSVEPFYPDGKPLLLRVRRDQFSFKKENGTPDIYFTKSIPAKNLEFLKDGKWYKLENLEDTWD